MTLLDVQDLQVELMTAGGVVRAVDGVSFTVGRSETVTLIGESGSGKSTTAMAVQALLPRNLAVVSGRCLIDGVDVVARPKEAARLRGRTIAMIPQDPMTALSPVATVGRQLGEVLARKDPGLSRTARRHHAADLLDSVRITEPRRRLDAYPHQLSGGMLQRVLIAMALAIDPHLLVADEPTSALDVTVQAGILDLLMDLQDRTSAGILMITHDIGVARLVSDRVHVMRDGRFVESGEVETVVGAPTHDYTRRLLDAVPKLGTWDGDVA
ncbi:ABC transporter ATP-binding protein [Jiangella ureilytica]|uniref:ABC transporter ATP-binding protein n=1 Tax=Jiangella ureilytica TaxID=2530374 RepID=A0A4R4RHN9_9ACTN|nr:ABC transporter ATP-binding protein [Jiangella ureilytica]TDC48786.1 ABC transporter ATP-binding protein [Jiangella ureilytica]